ncbi:aspartate-semialdehyde dehydrogenase [Mobilicoccus pelagius]|uniref:aspartate-semialdehyde dehydrogenase n=1 Tax=Mobilicoccus pelagius TaxID=746032 RepID=UPI0002FCC41F|nr:aspartate-semialdehyde dehydrogenase [Mobilicoccus pelagius]
MGERPRPTLAIVGATGAVGAVMLEVVSQRADVWGEIRLLASARSAGRTMSVRGEDVVVRELDAAAFDGVDVAVFLVHSEVAAEYAPIAVRAGAVVIDTSRAFRAEPDVPLVVHGYNTAQVGNRPRGIVSSPTGATLVLLDAIGALHSGWGLTDLVVTTMEAASGAGEAGIARLHDEIESVAGERQLGRHIGDVRRHVESRLPSESSPFPAPLALNVVPWTGRAAGEGWSTAEMSLRDELRKILDRPSLHVAATCVRVPVVSSHAMSVHARFEGPVSLEGARTALLQAPDVVVLDDVEHDDWPTPVDVTGSDPTFVGRLRQTADFPDAVDFVVCGDNLRKGAATNCAQIAETLAAELGA